MPLPDVITSQARAPGAHTSWDHRVVVYVWYAVPYESGMAQRGHTITVRFASQTDKEICVG